MAATRRRLERASIAAAASRHQSSRKRGAINCTPTGKPSAIPTGTTAAGKPSTGIAISVAHSRHTAAVRAALSTSKPCSYTGTDDTGASTSGTRSRNAVQSRTSRARSASAFMYGSASRDGRFSSMNRTAVRMP